MRAVAMTCRDLVILERLVVPSVLARERSSTKHPFLEEMVMAEQWKKVGTIWEKIPGSGGGGGGSPKGDEGPAIVAFFIVLIIMGAILKGCS